MENGNQIVPMSDIERMGTAIAKSGLFGMKTPEQAISLMLIAQAEGLHPAIAARDYHIIEGRPSLKADAMMARFQNAGGKVEFHDYTDEKVSATFTHPSGGTIKVDWTIDRAMKADVWKEKTSTGKPGMWVKYPRQMLKARVISEGIRAIFPGVNSGFYTPEEVQDFEPAQTAGNVPPRAEDKKPTIHTPAPEKREQPPKAEAQDAEYTAVDGLLTAEGTLDDVAVKEGDGKKGVWKRYGISINGMTIGTFDHTLGKRAQSMVGEPVKVVYTQEGKFFNLVDIAPVLNAPVSEEPLPWEEDNKAA